ncbi:MAG: hypothetical protein ACREQA_05695 [Candidatus Binatia bacterium]
MHPRYALGFVIRVYYNLLCLLSIGVYERTRHGSKPRFAGQKPDSLRSKQQFPFFSGGYRDPYPRLQAAIGQERLRGDYRNGINPGQ